MGNEWAMMAFAALASLAAGLAAALGVGEWRSLAAARLQAMALAGTAVLAGALAALVLKIGRPEMVFGVLGNPASGFFWEFVLAAATMACLIAFFAAHARWAEPGLTRCLAGAAALAGLALAWAAGSGLVMPWRAAWNTQLIPAAFLAGALVIAALWLALAAPQDPLEGRIARAAGLAAAAALLVLEALYLRHLAASPELAAEGAFARVVAGNLAPVWWAAALLGAAVPAAALALGRSAKAPIAAAMACALAGVAALEGVFYQLGMPTWHFF